MTIAIMKEDHAAIMMMPKNLIVYKMSQARTTILKDVHGRFSDFPSGGQDL